MRGLARLFAVLFVLVVGALALGLAIPGPQRVLVPEGFGLTEIAPRVWTDAPDRAEALLALARGAQDRVAAAFGGDPPRPTLVLCSTEPCARDFGVGGNGLALGPFAVLVAPGGLTAGTLTHEMTHARLHRGMGLRTLVRQPYPTWFDEGLATYVADHPVWRGPITAEDRARVRQVTRFWQLDEAFDDLGVGRTYRAAAAEVAAIADAGGPEGLGEVIRRAGAGEDFGAVVAEVTGR